jgi:SAM-dependent methyltransferase
MAGALYDGFISEYYDASPVVASRVDVRFYVNAAKEFGEPVLELGCGTGRITLPIAQAGFRITGLDLAARMLARAEEKAAELPEEAKKRLTLAVGNMTDFGLAAKFALVIIPFRPFQHLLETQQQLDCLACARKHMEPGGRLILDFFQTDPRRMHEAQFREERLIAEYSMSRGRQVALTERVTQFHRAEQRNDVEMIYSVRHPDGAKERLVLAWTVRYFFRYEVEHLLARCGFRVEETFGDWDRSGLQDDSPEMIFVARAV